MARTSVLAGAVVGLATTASVAPAGRAPDRSAVPVAHVRSTAGTGGVDGIDHGRRRPHVGSTDSASPNWAGYAAYGGSYTYVWGQWRVPRVNCSWGATGASSAWVGLDGYSSTTVEQLGTRQNCLWGVESYYPWFELYPSNSETALPGNYPVRAGDQMTAYVHYRSGYYDFYMADSTAGWSWSTSVRAPSPAPSNTSAEWILEQPSCFYECSWLPNFGSVTFTRAYAQSASGAGPITAFPYDPITMVDASGLAKAFPTSLTPDSYGDDFIVKYVRSS